MDKLRRTLSFRSRKKKRRQQTESSKPHQWQEDERKVREGTCSFQVKYLGCVEVFDSRGMHICEDAHKILRQNAKKSHRLSFRKKSKKRQRVVQAVIYVSGDSLRVIEDKAGISADDGQGLIVDQTIEKVSFCAPDRNHEKGFAYICRDGTTRRWMCHGFLALKESGERLSHAVGCAFAVCLEKKQKREKEAVSVSYSDDKTSFSRLGSFRQATLTERLADPQSTKLVEPIPGSGSPGPGRQNVEIAQVERPHASANLLLRQGSFNTFNKLNSQTSPFKRNLSLRLNDLPSNLSRQQAEFDIPVTGSNVPIIEGEDEDRLESPRSATLASALTDTEPSKQAVNAWDPIAEMCQQLTKGLTGLNTEEQKSGTTTTAYQTQNSQPISTGTAVVPVNGANPIQQTNPWAAPAPQDNDFWLPPSSIATSTVQAGVTSQQTAYVNHSSSIGSSATSSPHIRPRPMAGSAPSVGSTSTGTGTQLAQTYPLSNPHQPHTATQLPTNIPNDPFKQPTFSVSSTNQHSSNTGLTNGGSGMSGGVVAPPTTNPQNPFDTAWALRNNTSTNPFLADNSAVVSSSVTVPTSTATASKTAQGTAQFSKEFEINM